MVKVGVIGSAGLVGLAVIDKALAEGHQVLALSSSPKYFSLPRYQHVQIVEGSHHDGASILKLVKGGCVTDDRSNECDVVVVCVVDLITNESKSMSPVIVSLLVAKPKRIVVVTANGCNAPLSLGVIMQKMFDDASYSFKDVEHADKLVQNSKRQPWLLIRPNNMIDEGKTLSTWKYNATQSQGIRKRSCISTRDVAQFIVDHLENPVWDNDPVHLYKAKREVRDGDKICCLYFLHPQKRVDVTFDKSSFHSLNDSCGDEDETDLA